MRPAACGKKSTRRSATCLIHIFFLAGDAGFPDQHRVNGLTTFGPGSSIHTFPQLIDLNQLSCIPCNSPVHLSCLKCGNKYVTGKNRAMLIIYSSGKQKGSNGITKTPLYMGGKEGVSPHINKLTKKVIN